MSSVSETDPLVRGFLNSGKDSIFTPSEGSHKAYIVSNIFRQSTISMCVVLQNQKQALRFFDDVRFFLPDLSDQILYFPGYHIQAFKALSYHKETITDRLSVLSKLADASGGPLLLVTVIDTLMHRLIPKSAFSDFCELLEVNEEVDRPSLLNKLEAGGYTRTTLVEDPGDYSIRGGLLDIYSPGSTYPVRVEFFDDLVESIRHFSVFSQRTIKELNDTIIYPASEVVIDDKDMPDVLARIRAAGAETGLEASMVREYVNAVREFKKFPGLESMLSLVYKDLGSLLDYVPDDACWIFDEPVDLERGAQDFTQAAELNYQHTVSENHLCVSPGSIYLEWDFLQDFIKKRPHVVFSSLEFHAAESDGSRDKAYPIKFSDNTALKTELHAHINAQSPISPLVNWIEDQQKNHKKVLFAMSQEAQANRLTALMSSHGIDIVTVPSFSRFEQMEPGLYCVIGNLSAGFIHEARNFSLVTENEIFAEKRVRRAKSSRRDLKTEFIAPEELKNGDIVVHVEHGVGRYEGLCSLSVNNISQDFILLVYQDNDKLYLPVDRIEMIGKYIGVDGYEPVLDKIGSKAWAKSKVKAKKEVEKLAADLLDLYAKRKVNKGFSFSIPDNYYNEFETSFPYEETKDQLRAIDDVHLDMESDVPMDRLVCGDVGYGKTEVAIRAAFKAVNDGKQVAVVVPTTILAEQHWNTFKERFANYPVNIECLSRFRKKAEQTRIVKGIQSGGVDIAIGTHRLLQKDIDFKSLGLLVIDEEQRFGVKHKEALKKKAQQCRCPGPDRNADTKNPSSVFNRNAGYLCYQNSPGRPSAHCFLCGQV